MPYRVYLHNGEMPEDYVLVKDERELRAAIHNMVNEKEDAWYNGDTITVEKITDVEASNEVFWEKLQADMRGGR